MQSDKTSGWYEQRRTAWYEAAEVRVSRRSYEANSLDDSVLDALEEACAQFRPYDDARVELVRAPGVDVFRGVVGSYGKVSGAPHLLVVVAETTSDSSRQHAGYTGEGIVLEATAQGAGTCWIGGYFDPKAVASLVEIGNAERVFAVSPLGRAQESYTGSEHALRLMARSHRRKQLDEIAPGHEGWPSWAQRAVECARLAPSAVNRQPWRFRLEDGALVVGRENGREVPVVSKALDCGIAMLHAELGAFADGVEGAWRSVDGDGLDVARFTPRA